MSAGGPYVVLEHLGRGGSYHVALSVWESPRDAALLVLIGRDGWRQEGDPYPIAVGTELVQAPSNPGYLVEVDPAELARMAADLEAGLWIDTRSDPDDPDYDEEDSWTEAGPLPPPTRRNEGAA